VGGINFLVPVDAKLAVDNDIQFEPFPQVGGFDRWRYQFLEIFVVFTFDSGAYRVKC